MSFWHVRSGNVDQVVEAGGREDAFEAALRAHDRDPDAQPQVLGVLVEFSELRKEPYYCLSENLLSDIGISVEQR